MRVEVSSVSKYDASQKITIGTLYQDLTGALWGFLYLDALHQLRSVPARGFKQKGGKAVSFVVIENGESDVPF